jgi:hypothetical protein
MLLQSLKEFLPDLTEPYAGLGLNVLSPLYQGFTADQSVSIHSLSVLGFLMTLKSETGHSLVRSTSCYLLHMFALPSTSPH